MRDSYSHHISNSAELLSKTSTYSRELRVATPTTTPHLAHFFQTFGFRLSVFSFHSHLNYYQTIQIYKTTINHNRNRLISIAIMKTLSLLTSALALHETFAFMNSNSIKNGRGFLRPSIQETQISAVESSTTSQNMILSADSVQDFSTATVAQNAGMLISSQQNHEAQLFGDLAHFLLDVVTFSSPDTMLLRLLILCGRICSILSDYVPDHSMTYDEIAFQSTMLTIAGNKFYKKLSTTISSLKEATSFRDGRIYRNMFSPAGFTWIQYKTLLLSEVLQWSMYKPGEIFVQDSSSLFITYKGEVEQFKDGLISRRYGSCGSIYCHEVIGDLSQGSEIVLDRKKRKSLKDRQDVEEKVNIFRSGSTGSMLLRIDVNKLMQISEDDDDISENTKNLYLNVMQKKLISYSEGPTLGGYNGTNTYALLP